MAHSGANNPQRGVNDRQMLAARAWPLFALTMSVGAGGLLLSVLFATFENDGYRRFSFAYLINYAYFLSIALGALFFVMIQHLTRAGWSVTVRRVAELLAAAIPILAALFAPVLLMVVLPKADLYRWAGPVQQHMEHEASHVEEVPVDVHHADHAGQLDHAEAGAHHGHDETPYILAKRPYLNREAFVSRWLIYFGIWSALAMYFWRRSVRQDKSGDSVITIGMEKLAAPGLLLFGLTITFAAFDLLMSLSPAWYSTIFGVYYFAGCVIASVATIIVLLMLLQRSGLLVNSVSESHYHDLGKLLFAFVFFWAYIAFSQYMLIWYANLPETTYWFKLRGWSTAAGDFNVFSVIGLVLLFGHFILPFLGLISSRAKRRRKTLLFWALWMLVMHWIDLYWLVMPELSTQLTLGFIELFSFVGIGGLYAAGVVRLAANYSLVPEQDPRLHEALAAQHA